MVTTTLKQHVVELEQNYWQALKDNDVERAIEMTDNPCLVAGGQGVSRIDHNAYREMMKSPTWTLDDFAILGEPEVRMITDDVGIIAYTVHEIVTVDGKRQEFDAAQASTWKRMGDRWACSMHAESILGDPFARDR